ncbi:DUF2155 domain-containing protein [Sinorhizobium meliloti]|nr:DUF2155 domain-containing protein [Sinorhizobium meliloti]
MTLYRRNGAIRCACQVTPRVCQQPRRNGSAEDDHFCGGGRNHARTEDPPHLHGWMLRQPGAHAVEHPVYDVWLQSCKTSSDVPPPDTAAKQ